MQSALKRLIASPDFIRVFVLRTIGNFLVLLAVFLVIKTFWQPVSEELRFFLDEKTGKEYVVSEEIPKGMLAEALKKRNIEVLTPKDPNFSIVVPKIGANANILASVNAANEKEYLTALQKGVAHAKGTAFPGEGGNVYLFAHSTDYFWNVGSYNAVFYLLYKLKVGDEVNIFYGGQRYVYQVSETKVVDPREVQYLTRQTDNELLTLQTCWPPGTTLKRLLVFAKRVAE